MCASVLLPPQLHEAAAARWFEAPGDDLTTTELSRSPIMAKAISTADSAARLDPAIPLIAKPACPHGHVTVAHVRARTAG